MSLPDSPQQQLDWEARHRTRAAIAAAVAAVGIVGGQVLEQLFISGVPSLPMLDGLQKLAEPGSVLEQPTGQIVVAEYLQDHAFQQMAARTVTAIGFFALAYAVTFLAAAVRARRPEFARWAFYLPIVGGVLYGVAWIAHGVGRLVDANRVIDGPGTIASIQDLGTTGLSRVSEVLLNPAALVLAVGLVLVSLNAMRTGLLTRFLGALGIVAGVLLVLQFGSGLPLVQAFWLGSLAVLFAGRRPGGDPPAWRTGRAEPWPTAQQAAEQRRAQAEAGAASDPVATGPVATDSAPTEPAAPDRVPAGAHPATSKRKRKRRT